jgi:hypothetical protein
MKRVLTVFILVIVSSSLNCNRDGERRSEIVRFYHGTDYDTAVKLFNDRNLTPRNIEGYMALGFPSDDDPRTGYRSYTDFGQGLYTHLEDEALAIEWAKKISKNKGAKKWGVVVFYVTQDLLDQAENPLIYETKGSRSDNAPVLPNSAGQRANWLQFIEHNRRIPYKDIQKPRDSLWDAYDWIKGPMWVPKDSDLGGDLEPFPDSLHQVNWVRGLNILNEVERDLKSGDVDQDEADTPGSDPQEYFVYVLDISGGSVWVGQESALQSTPRCSFAGGGLCEGDGNNPPRVITKSQGFQTLEEAKAAWCSELKGKAIEYWPVAGDSKAAVYGGKYWVGLAPGCN